MPSVFLPSAGSVVYGSGIDIDDTTPSKFGGSISVAIDNTQRRFDTTSLAGTPACYPMRIQLEARGAPCFVRQGGSGIVLGGENDRLLADDWSVVTVDSASDAYFAIIAYNSTVSGLLVATRKDSI